MINIWNLFDYSRTSCFCCYCDLYTVYYPCWLTNHSSNFYLLLVYQEQKRGYLFSSFKTPFSCFVRYLLMYVQKIEQKIVGFLCCSAYRNKAIVLYEKRYHLISQIRDFLLFSVSYNVVVVKSSSRLVKPHPS